MEQKLSYYFKSVKDPRMVARCTHLLTDILIVAVCTYVTGGIDFQDMFLFCKERGDQLKGSLLELPNGTPSVDTFERVFKRLDVETFYVGPWFEFWKLSYNCYSSDYWEGTGVVAAVNLGYKFQFSSGFYMRTGGALGTSITTSGIWNGYEGDSEGTVVFFGMLDFTLGIAF
jgi:hypothetical protein